MKTLPFDFFLACKQPGVCPTRFVLVVRIASQTVSLFEKSCATSRLCINRPDSAAVAGKRHTFVKRFRCSASRFGIGQAQGSNRTPLGLHRIAEKIGGGWPVGAVFKSRQAVGYTWQGLPDATITSRILWLEGLEPGFNRGGISTFTARATSADWAVPPPAAASTWPRTI